MNALPLFDNNGSLCVKRGPVSELTGATVRSGGRVPLASLPFSSFETASNASVQLLVNGSGRAASTATEGRGARAGIPLIITAVASERPPGSLSARGATLYPGEYRYLFEFKFMINPE